MIMSAWVGGNNLGNSRAAQPERPSLFLAPTPLARLNSLCVTAPAAALLLLPRRSPSPAGNCNSSHCPLVQNHFPICNNYLS